MGRTAMGGFSLVPNWEALAQGKLNVPSDRKLPNTDIFMPHVIVADEAFPLKTYLMRPFPRTQLDDVKKQHYNYRHCRARRVSENAFGILSQKFRLYNRKIQLKPENADVVVLATCILHNYIITSGNIELPTSNEHLESVNNMLDLPLQGGSSTQRAFQVRDTFADFFSSESGSVEWRNN